MRAQTATAVRLRAVSVDTRLADRLGPGLVSVGSVHSIHDRAVNVRTADGLLCCLATGDLEDAPRTVRIDADSWATARWDVGAPVDVDLTGATGWLPSPADLSGLTPSGLLRAAAAIDRQLPRPAGRTDFERASADLLGRRTTQLAAALQAQDAAATTRTAEALVGLGAGLTPSGDDVLTGLLVLAAAEGMRLASARPALRAAVADRLEARTTAVSAAMLTEAADGRARQRLHDLVAAIAADSADGDLATAIRRVREIGHSSGADVLAGMRLGLTVESLLRSSTTGHRPRRTPSPDWSPTSTDPHPQERET
ncbi:DUF2877 domain-containing protein [Nocardioides albidus]|uniref:DUF2877 domain-containing protein n=1 Tax=Nocardioides albidus TaxID=1517589 RepID=A0A5C4WPT1_9ACTN|nr:DUF2877 domain-containing protein [Nocardioides albidus]TNM49546.1 DUF2877 domain-containing protein [Nocardioides albidus]